MAVINAKLLCLCLVAVAATVAAHEAQTLPGKGGKGHHGVQTLPDRFGGGGGGIPPRPQVQPRPDKYKPIVRPGKPIFRPGKPIDRPGRPSNHPTVVPPYSGPLTKPRPRPSKGGDRFRRSNHYDSDESDESDEGRYRRQVDDEFDDELYEDDGEDEYYDEEEV